MKRWAVGNVRTGEELGVARRLDEFGVETYCPIFTRTVRPARKRRPVEVEKAAFQGYLFVNERTIMDPEEIYRDSRFHYFIRDWENELVLLQDAVIEEMRSRALLGAFQPRYTSGPQFAIGEVVKVPGGPCGGMKGQVVAMSRGHYLLDNLDFTKGVWFSGLQLLKESL